MPPDTEADSLCECVGHDIYLGGVLGHFKRQLDSVVALNF